MLPLTNANKTLTDITEMSLIAIYPVMDLQLYFLIVWGFTDLTAVCVKILTIITRLLLFLFLSC